MRATAAALILLATLGLAGCRTDKPGPVGAPVVTRQPDGLLPPSALGPLVRLGVRPEAADTFVELICANFTAGVSADDRATLIRMAGGDSSPAFTKDQRIAMIREAVRVNCPDNAPDEAAFEAALASPTP